MDYQLILGTSSQAWQSFCKAWKSWALLASGAILLQVLIVSRIYYAPEYANLIAWLACLPMALYTALLQQNGLDAAYDRKLSMWQITSPTLFAGLFFIAISLYNPFPEYTDYLLMVFPEDFRFILAINWLVHGLISYILMRCMFVGMVILEEKLHVIHAFRKSFRLTAHHILLLLVCFAYFAVVLFLGSLTVIGYFITFPYIILMKAFLYKQMRTKIQ